MQRVLYDPDPVTGADRSLRSYIHKASSGVADLDAVVLPMETVDQQDVAPNVLETKLGPQLRAQGFDAAAIVMLGGLGAGTSAGYWNRFVMLENVGVWAMEFMHSLTGFADLYPFGGNLGSFDEMACSCGTHPTAYTKAAIGWLGAFAIAQHGGGSADYDLYSVGLVQPPPSGRWAAVKIGAQVPYLMVEARQRVDAFDRNIAGEGVIVYQVQTSDPLGWAQNNTAPIRLLTTTPLQSGATFVSPSGQAVRVTNAIAGGFSVNIDDATRRTVPTVLGMSLAQATSVLHDSDLNTKAAFVVDRLCNDIGTVMRQSPSSGTIVLDKSTVTVTIGVRPVTPCP